MANYCSAYPRARSLISNGSHTTPRKGGALSVKIFVNLKSEGDWYAPGAVPCRAVPCRAVLCCAALLRAAPADEEEAVGGVGVLDALTELNSLECMKWWG